MSLHSTNYYNTFIQIAEDSPVTIGQIPPLKGNKRTVANIQFDLISKNPYKFTSDDVLFQVFADRSDLTEGEYAEARAKFFSKGQPCLRASALTKRYGWGVHYDNNGKIAIFGAETPEYQNFISTKGLKTLKAMRSSK